ncbi:MAG TPA: GAF domain-containing protein [Ilumatobacteraceae bacterium]|jgi:hypothetical protein|nr:GAF domain-containing protein [Ilumatobacteraceae bacterium]
MTTDRRDWIVAEIVGSISPSMDSQRLSSKCAEVAGVDGAGITLMSNDAPWRSLNASDQVSERLGEVQLSFHEGPGVDAHARGEPVAEPDLHSQGIPRWPAYTAPALEAGVRAVFGYPLRVGGVRLGAMDLHSRRAGWLKDEQHRDALMLADVVARAILLVQARARPAQVAQELWTSSDYQSIVNQASGMAAVQLGVGVGAALVRMRVYAFGISRPFAEVAEDIVARRLRFDPERRQTQRY